MNLQRIIMIASRDEEFLSQLTAAPAIFAVLLALLMFTYAIKKLLEFLTG